MRIRTGFAAALAVVLCAAVWAGDAPAPAPEPAVEADPMPEVDFVLSNNVGEDGKPSLGPFKESKGWHVTDFKGRANVRVEDGVAILETGKDMTGITWRGPLVRMNYEITLEAKRVAGEDFFCGLTFPYGPDPCSLIVGGWGGTLVGLSSLEYNDAYNNETARFMQFEKDRWYRIRLRCTEQKIQAWIDDKQMVDLDTAGRKIGIRWEVERSQPLGIATWCTTGAIRNVKLYAYTAPPEPEKDDEL